MSGSVASVSKLGLSPVFRDMPVFTVEFLCLKKKQASYHKCSLRAVLMRIILIFWGSIDGYFFSSCYFNYVPATGVWL